MTHRMHRIDRKDFLKMGAVATIASQASALAAQDAKPDTVKTVRIGLVGLGKRGSFLLRSLLTNHPGVSVPALCDVNTERLAQGIQTVKRIQGNTPTGYSKDEYDYRNMFARDDLDGILLAVDVQWFGKMAADALKAGKHVGTEVTGPHTLDDCWSIVREKERSGKRYMHLENCCYGRDSMMVLNMIRQGVLGEPYYAECSYVHDIKGRFIDADGKLSWRGRLLVDGAGNSYPTHAVGSAAKWLSINDGDRFVSCVATQCDPREWQADAIARFGQQSPAAKVVPKTGDFVAVLIRTAKGKMIRVDYSFTCTRPYSRYYLLQGMNGCFDSRSGMYVKGTSPSYEFEPIAKYYEKFDHPFWRKDADIARKTGGHGGMDYFCIRDFVKMLREDREPWIDCYDSASWSSIYHCSSQSIAQNGAPVEMPDFTGGRWKDPNWRK